MYPIGHFGFGFICGILIFFLLTKIAPNRIGSFSKSKMLISYTIFALICGLISVAPDYGQLWGDHKTDHAWWAYLCFGHRSIDIYLWASGLSDTDTAILSYTILGLAILMEIVILYVYILKKDS